MIPKSLAQRFLKDLKKDVEIRVYRSKDMLRFAEELSKLSERICVEFYDHLEPKLNLPAISVGNVFFHTIPMHNELESFLFALKIANSKRIYDYRCDIITFVSQFCPNCRITVDSINRIAMESLIEHHVVDVVMFPDLASKYDVRSVPTTIIGDFRIEGAMDLRDVKSWIEVSLNNDYSTYFADKLMNGELDLVKRTVLSNPRLSKVLGELMAHREFIVRLGAMAAIESLWKINPDIVSSAKGEIRSLLRHRDVRIREDAAMMLGMIGNIDDLIFLEEFEDDKDIGEVVREAIKMIRRKERG